MGRRSRRRPVEPPAGDPPPADRYARSRERDAQARAALEPLALGERPRAVTVAAVVAFAMAIANVVAAALGADLGAKATGVTVISTALLVACAAGMWLGARYWAVLGFMMIIVFQVLSLSFALVRVRHWWAAVAIVAAIALLGWLFVGLVRALARIQMPERPAARPRH